MVLSWAYVIATHINFLRIVFSPECDSLGSEAVAPARSGQLEWHHGPRTREIELFYYGNVMR
jgi:hypothetical protein